MARLSREQAEKALRLKKKGLGYRKIEEELNDAYGEDNVPTFSNIYDRLKPIVNGEKTLDEAFPEEGEEKQSEGGEKIEENLVDNEDLEVEVEEKTKEDSSLDSNTVLITLWVLFAILVIAWLMT